MSLCDFQYPIPTCLWNTEKAGVCDSLHKHEGRTLKVTQIHV